jgi:hypothetical protein
MFGVDPLAIGALAGFGVLLLICIGITVWFVGKVMKAEPAEAPKLPDDDS